MRYARSYWLGESSALGLCYSLPTVLCWRHRPLQEGEFINDVHQRRVLAPTSDLLGFSKAPLLVQDAIPSWVWRSPIQPQETLPCPDKASYNGSGTPTPVWSRRPGFLLFQSGCRAGKDEATWEAIDWPHGQLWAPTPRRPRSQY